MTVGRLADIRRHPVKSAGGEGLDRVTLAAARRLPGDRAWAVLTEDGARHAGPEAGRWLPKSCFLRGAAAPSLMAVSGGWEGDRLVLTHPDAGRIAADPRTEADAILAWLAPLWPDGRGRPVRLVQGAGLWTDQQWPWLSVASTATLAAIEAAAGRPLGRHRWRMNLWIDGWAPHAERDWIGRILTIGGVELRITEPVGRCTATDADTATGRRDGDTCALLEDLTGAADFGFFAEVVTGGPVAVGDRVTAGPG